MFGREVWGWRLLALMLVLLLVPTITQIETLENEWRESIESTPIEGNEQSTGEDISADDESLAEDPADDPATNSAESSEGDSAESSEGDSEDKVESLDAPPESSGEGASMDNEDEPQTNNQQEWILPATQVIVLTMMAIMAVGLITSTATALLASEAARFTILLAVFGPLIAITQRGEGGAFTRGRILGFVEAHPGIHFSALRDALQLGNGVTAHHIQVLEKEGRLISWMDGKVRRFASSGVNQKRLKDIQNPVTGMQIAILQVLSESGKLGIQSGELRVKLETSRQLLSYHMKQLTARNFVSSTGKGRALKWSLLEEGKKQLDNSTHLAEIS
jgi:DNA-binding MarR family transcriptional regulator